METIRLISALNTVIGCLYNARQEIADLKLPNEHSRKSLFVQLDKMLKADEKFVNNAVAELIGLDDE